MTENNEEWFDLDLMRNELKGASAEVDATMGPMRSFDANRFGVGLSVADDRGDALVTALERFDEILTRAFDRRWQFRPIEVLKLVDQLRSDQRTLGAASLNTTTFCFDDACRRVSTTGESLLNWLMQNGWQAAISLFFLGALGEKEQAKAFLEERMSRIYDARQCISRGLTRRAMYSLTSDSNDPFVLTATFDYEVEIVGRAAYELRKSKRDPAIARCVGDVRRATQAIRKLCPPPIRSHPTS